MKNLFLIAMVAIVAFFSSCEKNDLQSEKPFSSSAQSHSSCSVDFTINADSITSFSEISVFLVPSENTGAPVAYMKNASVGKNVFVITPEDEASLKNDAYFTVIITTLDGRLIQNFFGIKEKNHLSLSPTDMYESDD